MKKLILFLLTFFSLSVSAQLQKSVMYDFTKPKELTPSVTPLSPPGNEPVASYVFKNKQVSISFKAGASPAVAFINSYKNPYTGIISYSLKLNGTAYMKIALSDGAVLDSIRFYTKSLGDLSLAYGEPGIETCYQDGLLWKSDSKEYSEVSFHNNSSDSFIEQLYVYYTTPSELLVPVACSLNPEDILSKLDKFTLTFGSNVTVQDASSIQLVSEAGNVRTVSAKAKGKEITLTLDKAITTDDLVTITIPAKCFKDSEGFENKELTYTFKIVEPRNSLKYTSVTPKVGSVDQLGNTISIAYKESVKLSSSDDVILYKNGEELYPMSISVSETDDKKVVLSHNHEAITDNGVYTLTIPEGMIHNGYYQVEGSENLDRYNAGFELKYTITSGQPQGDSETMKAAKELLKNTGVGYPAASSTARKSLTALTTATTVPSDAELSDAIDAFYAESDIMLPASNKYYKLIAVNAGGDQLFLSYKNGRVVLSDEATDAAAFKATLNSDKSVILQTNDGKYLHVLVAGNSYQGTSDKNVTDQCTEDINHLRVARLAVTGKTKETFGFVSLYGSLGIDNVLGSSENAYALIDHGTNKIVTASKYTTLYFDNKLSNAFKFEETDAHAGLTPIKITGKLSPETVKSNTETLTLTLSGADTYTMESPSVVYFADESGARVVIENQGAILSAVGGVSNKYSVHLNSLAEGNYQLVIPEGVFKCTSGATTSVSAEVKLPFSINSAETDDFNYSFYSFSYLQDKGVSTPVTDESLNEMVLFIQTGYTDMIADGSKEVRLAYYDTNATIRTGHFVAYPDIVKLGYKGAHAIKLVLDEPIKKGELRSGKYTWAIPAATFGDANFGKWLKNPGSISKSECKVNLYYTISVNVNNSAATDINMISIENEDSVIYDLTGRRLNKVTKAGLYIVNGKKVYVK